MSMKRGASSALGSLCGRWTAATTVALRGCATTGSPSPAIPTGPTFTAAAVSGGVQLTRQGEGAGGAGKAATWWLAPGWLRENCSAVRHATGQSTVTLEEMAAVEGSVIEAAVVPGAAGGDDVLRCVLSTAGEGAGLTCSDEDAVVSTLDVPLQRTLGRYGVTQMGLSSAVKAVTSQEAVSRLQYADVVEACKDPQAINDVRKELFRSLTADGITLIQGCPTAADSGALEALARAVAPVSGMAKTLYGTDFHVNRDPGAAGPRNNIAYSGVFLDLHNDLVYHESMPGIQMLLAQRFDASVQGGESFFVDAMAAAEELRVVRPDAFDVLTRMPRPFCKDDPKRPIPACYYYGAPHIVTCALTGHVSKVFWAPAFEAPFPVWVDEGAQKMYYDARRAFAAVLLQWRQTHAVVHRMQPGECFIWNQVRVLHGRMAFNEAEPGTRSLHGCYCNIDDFASAARYTLGSGLPQVPLANRSEL